MKRANGVRLGKDQDEIAAEQILEKPLDEMGELGGFIGGKLDCRGVVAAGELAGIEIEVFDQRGHPVTRAVIELKRPMAGGHHPDVAGQVLLPGGLGEMRQVLFVRRRNEPGERAVVLMVSSGGPIQPRICAPASGGYPNAPPLG